MFRKPYNKAGRIVGHCCAPLCGDSMTQQNFKQTCDINDMIRRHQAGEAVPAMTSQARLGVMEMSGLEYHEMLTRVKAAQESFMDLPSDVRDRFKNDPAKMLEFVRDDENFDEAVELGLVPAPEKAEPVSVDDAPPPDAA